MMQNDVKQVDRDYGAILLENRLKEAGMISFQWAGQVIDEVRNGAHDNHYYVQNSAAHRIAAEAAKDAEIAALQARVAELEGFAADVYANTDNDSLSDRAKQLLGLDKEPTQ